MSRTLHPGEYCTDIFDELEKVKKKNGDIDGKKAMTYYNNRLENMKQIARGYCDGSDLDKTGKWSGIIRTLKAIPDPRGLNFIYKELDREYKEERDEAERERINEFQLYLQDTTLIGNVITNFKW